jgi:hypothetical protein
MLYIKVIVSTSILDIEEIYNIDIEDKNKNKDKNKKSILLL